MLTVRVAATVFPRLDALAAKLSRPGLELKRSDAARIALETGIDVLEKEDEKPKS